MHWTALATRSSLPHFAVSPIEPFGPDVRADLDVVHRMAAGDERALAEAFDRFGTLAYSLAAAMLGDTRDAEEAVSDAFSQLWRSAGEFDASRGSLRAWIVTVVRSRALDRLRARRRAERLVSTEEHGSGPLVAAAADPAEGPDLNAEGVERRARVEAALAALPARQREALHLAYFEGLSQSEIAQRLQEPLGTVKTRVRAALAKLRSLLEPLRDQEEL